MCGIFAYLGTQISMSLIEIEFEKIRMRGPDCSQLKWIREGWLLGFHRLKIVDISDEANCINLSFSSVDPLDLLGNLCSIS